MTHARRPLGAIAAAVLVLAPAAPAADAGLFLTVPSPLTSDGYTRLRNVVEEARKKPADQRPAKVVFDFNPADKDAATAEFGPCGDLAAYIAGLQDLTTVGYVHRKVSGHTVLPVLACQQIVLGPAGALGEVVGAGEPKPNDLAANGYAFVVGKVRPAYLAVAQKMFDPAVQLRKGKKGGADYYFDLRNRADAEKAGVQVADTTELGFARDNTLPPAFGATTLRDLGLSRLTVDSPLALLEAFGLPPSALRADRLGGRAAVAFHYTLRGPIDKGAQESVARLVEKVAAQNGNLLFLELQCAGGDPQAARDLAQKLIRLQKPDDTEVEPIQIVAFVPDKAPDTAAILALGCSDIVMSKRKDAGGDDPPEAEFGDFEAVVGKNPKAADTWVASLRPLAEAQGYPPLLVDAMLNKDVEIVRVRRKENRAVTRLMTGDELKADQEKGDRAEWVVESQVKPKGQLLKLSATKAEELGLARYTVDTRQPAEVYAKYGVEPGKVKEASPAWLDRFASFLKDPRVTVLLVVIGFTGLILELKVPGATVPGIVAALCFIMVFWAHTQFSGQLAVLAGLLFLLGLVLILMEVFVLPGFGVAGIMGIGLILGSLGLVAMGEVPRTTGEWVRFGGKMAQYFGAMIVSMVAAFAIARFLPNIPYANRLMLVPPGEKPGTEEPPLPGAVLAASLLGAVGTAVTVLRPAGSVRFGDQFIDVVTDGGYVPAGSRVQVIEVEGTRIVVKEV